jgi:ferredoxin-fold anticodon binding domain-containing protein
MVYLIKCANDQDVSLQVVLDDKFVDIKIEDKYSGESQSIYLKENDLFQLIGVLHYIQKQIKK